MRVSDAVGTFAMVFILPDDINITSGSPKHHRTFLDMYLCQVSHRYLNSLMEYLKVLKQRNALLRKLKNERSSEGLRHLDSWDENLIGPALEVVQSRQDFITEIKPIVSEIASNISGESEAVEIGYLPSLGPPGTRDRQNTIELYKKERIRDIRVGSTHLGPHRDLIDIHINSIQLRNYGSMGQKKSVMIAMKLAALEALTRHRGEPAILILDEAFAALDENRSRSLLKLLGRYGQVFLASATAHDSIYPVKIFNVINGIVKKRDT